MAACSQRVQLVAACLTSCVIAGCTVGPNYVTPDLSARFGEHWSELSGQQRPASSDLLTLWWRSFGDKELSALIERSLASNLHVLEAQERIITARARRGVINADRLPRLDADVSYTRTEQGNDAPM